MTRLHRARSLITAGAIAALTMLTAAVTVLAGSGPGPFPK